MPSDYSSFEVLVDNDDGTTTFLPAQTVSIYDVTNDADLGDIASDANGHVSGGTLAVAVGTVVRFHTALANGQCGYKEETTV